MPVISIIIPVFNGEKKIQKTIKSVLNQTFSDFELIVINDGSQDLTLDIIKEIHDERLQVFCYPNAGQAVSRNRGLSHARGEYISFIDADDLWTPDKLEAQFKALQYNPQASVAYSWTDYIDEQDNVLCAGRHPTFNGNVYENLLVTNFLENGSNPLICRQALVELEGFKTEFIPAEEWELYIRLADRYLFVAVPSVQILYRVSGTSMSANILRMEAACLQVINSAFDQGPHSLLHLKTHSMANLYKYLTCKAIQEPLNRHKSLIGAKFAGKYFLNDYFRFKNLTFTLKLLFKIGICVVLPINLSTVLLRFIRIKIKVFKYL